MENLVESEFQRAASGLGTPAASPLALERLPRRGGCERHGQKQHIACNSRLLSGGHHSPLQHWQNGQEKHAKRETAAASSCYDELQAPYELALPGASFWSPSLSSWLAALAHVRLRIGLVSEVCGLAHVRLRKFFRMRCYGKCVRKSFAFHCYKTKGLKLRRNDTLTKNTGGPPSLGGLEPICGRRSPQAKSRGKPRDLC